MYHITLSFLLLPVSVVLLRPCINLMARSSFPASVSVSTLLFCGGSGDSEADGGTGFLTVCSNPHPSSLLPGSGYSLAFGLP